MILEGAEPEFVVGGFVAQAEADMQPVFGDSKTEKGVGRRQSVSDVKLRAVLLDKFDFAQLSSFGRRTAFPGDCFGLVDQFDDLARFAFGLRIFVIAEANFQIMGLADVKNALRGSGEEIDTRLFWNGFEKVGSESFQQGLRKTKETKLLRTHAPLRIGNLERDVKMDAVQGFV
jgi:hypothetical protein